MKQFLKRMLLVALLCVPWVTNAQTDTLTVANGTATNSYIPIYGFYVDAAQHNQIIYPASMVASLTGDSITGMGFYMSSTASSSWNTTVTISLGITSELTLNGIDNNTSVTQVWQGTIDGQSDIWIEFDNAYPFQGGNLLVDIQTTVGNYSSAGFYGESQSGSTSLCNYYSYEYSQNFIPKTSFLHVAGEFTVCLMPSNLVVETDSTSINLTWNSAEGVDGYNIYLNDSLIEFVSDTTYTIEDLTHNTEYTINITSVCGDDGESAAIGGTYRTDCSLMQLPFFTSFENDPYGVFPPCWTRTLASGTDPSVNDVFSHTGTQSMYLQANYSYNLFASQAVPVDGNNIKVDFWARLSANYEGWIQAGVMTNPLIDSTFIPLLYINDMAGEFKHYNFSTHDLDANSTYYVAFKYYGTYAYNYGAGAIDDITISTTDGCAMPRKVVFDSIDTAFVTLSWVAGSNNDNYEVAYGITDDVNAATVISNITDLTYTIEGLNPNTYYHFWVRNICTTDDTTLWYYAGGTRTACSDGMNAPVHESFVGYNNEVPSCWTVLQSTDDYGTTCPYANPGNLYFYPTFGQPNLIVMPYIRLAANEMYIECRGYAYSYYPTTFEIGYVTDPTDASTFLPLGTIDATSATDYEFSTDTVTADTIWIAFRASTTAQYSYAYLYSVNVSHLGSCLRPDYLALDTVTYDMAELHCNTIENVNNYEVRYATVNNVESENAQTETSADGEFILSELSASTHYYTWVRSVCSDDEYSDWRQGPEFTTMCGEEFCLLEVDMHDSYGDGWNGHAINIYTNGVFQTSATIENGYSNYVQFAMCEGDSVVLTWTSGSFPGEVSFEISHAGMQVLSAGGSDFSNGDTVLVKNGCPACLPVSSVVAVDSLATDESITISWVPNSEDDSEWIVSIDGQVVDIATEPSYTFYNLTARTEYVVGVATYCGDGDTSEFVYLSTSTVCPGINCQMFIDMHDSYGDGWNGHAINMFLNNTLYTSATILSGNSGNLSLAMCEGDTVVLTGISGSYPGEVSFEIYHAGGLVLQGTGSDLNGDTILTLTGCPSCVSPTEIIVNNITTSSASISWNTDGAASTWHLTVNSAMAMLLDTIVTAVPINLNGLEPATGYTVIVSSICGDDTANSSYTTFISACEEITLPWFFDAFSDPSAYNYALPLCWYAPQTYDNYGSLYPMNTSYDGLTVYGSSGSSCMAASPRIPAAGNNVSVRFHASSYTYNGAVLTAGVMTDPTNPATYIPVVNITSTEPAEYEFTTDVITGLSATDTVYVAFQSVPPSGYGYGYIYLTDVYVQVIPNCHRPDSIVASNITDNTVTLTWPATDAANFTVSYNDTAFVVTGTSVTLTGLNAGTTYTVYLQGNCTTDSSLLQQVTFTTVCTPNTLPWSEGFEGYANYTTPNCWTFYDGYPDYNGHLSPFVYNYDYYAHSGESTLEFVGMSSIRPMAVSPALTGAAMNSLYVSFWVYGGSSYGFEAGLMTDPTDTTTFIPILSVPGTSYNCTQYGFMTNSLTNTDSTFHFAIRYYSTETYSGNIYIDDIEIVVMPECSETFDNVSISDVSGEGATFKWTPGLGINANSSFTVTLMDANYNVVSTINDAVSPLTFSGLNGNTEYNVAVSLNCGGSIAAVSDTVNFTTLCSGVETFFSFDSTMEESTSYAAPMGMSNWNYGYTQTIIDSARMIEGDIVGFAFLPATAEEGNYYTHMDVYMANVSENDLANGWITPDSNHVFVQVIDDVDMCYTTADWQQHVFSQRFTWDGHSNVLVAIRRSHGTYQYGASFYVHSDSTTVNKTRYAYNDYNAYDINDPTAANSSNNYTSDYVGDLKFLVCSDACPAPTSVTATVADYQSASATWSSNADSVDVTFKAATDVDFPVETRIANNGTYSLNNLNPATLYIFKVRSACEEGITSNWSEVTFVTDSLPCFAPTNLTVGETGYTTASFSWTENAIATQWYLHVWNSNFDTTYVANTNPFAISGLEDAQTFYASVRSNCNGFEESDNSDTVTFTTATCAPVSGVAVSNITPVSALVTWTGSATTYEVQCVLHGYGVGQGTQAFVQTTQHTLSGLESETEYDVYVRAVCETGVNSQWSQVVTFTTTAGQVTTYTITATANDATMGTVSGGGTYPVGTDVTLTAIANPGYVFVNWNDGVTTSTRTITVTGDASYVANFEAVPTYTITVSANNPDWGTVTGGGTFEVNTTTTITASANAGYMFASWDDGNTDAVRTITVTADHNYVATFVPEGAELNYYDVTVTVNDPAMGTVTGGGTHIVEGSVITLTATANAGYRFVDWSDGVTDNPRQITVNEDITLTANFEALPTYTITVNVNDPAMGTVTGGGTYPEGTEVTLTATPNNGYEFVKWNDNVTTPTRVITVTADATYTATFQASQIGIAEAEGMMNVSVYPNPATSTTTVALSGVSGDVTITVVDMNGRVVKSDAMSCDGSCTKLMEVGELAQGAYFIRVSGENVNMVKKLIVK